MKKNVLLASDVEMTKLKIISMLEKNDINIFEIHKSTQIFSKLKENNYDLLIIDSTLELKSIEIISEIKKFDKNIPIVLLSDSKSKKEFVKYIKIGISDFIIKPFTEKRLAETLNKFLFNSKNLIKKENLNFSYENIIKFELKKSKKGNYPLTFIIINFPILTGNILANIFIKKIIKDIWDTDEIVFYKQNVLLGIHPFSSVKNSEIISKKLHDKCTDAKKHNLCFENVSLNLKIFIDKPNENHSYDYYIEKFDEFINEN
jgi:CheY-like chemotaxis protein